MAGYTLVMILCTQILSISTAPLQMQYQSQLSVQPTQEELLQHQLFALQQLQNLQNLQMMNELNNYYPQAVQRQSPPLMILLPEDQLNNWNQMQDLTRNVNVKTKNNEQKDENEDMDSVVIDAEPQMEPSPEPSPKKAILLIPNRGRFSIGGLISAIPFLPIEVNVPDTISWIYDGIAGIIGGIGQRLPFKRPMQTPETPGSDANVRLLIKRLQNRNQNVPAPILMLPDVAQVYPMQF
ncbi:hypothetical protein ABMA28_015921 [Loxostege sticticalis]|uniref:Uncharacterized protein n=1 Tax=Loxostege sticticalis TaxID=481309 RepID=A0ABD0TDA0_LOXSC